jgi:hypothetical protein
MASIKLPRVLQLSSFSMRNSFRLNICTIYRSPSQASLLRVFVYGAKFDKIAMIDLKIGLSNLGPLLISP